MSTADQGTGDTSRAAPPEQRIVVVGSVNLDLTVPVAALPRPGETVLGGDCVRTPGGKGANQAVAVARLGRRVDLVGRVGDDDAGRSLRAALDDVGVGTGHLWATPGAPSGVALITVDDGGENTIAVSPGANSRLTAADVAAAHPLLAGARVTLLQLEVPLEAVAAAVDAAGGTVVLNPAPARSLPPALLAGVDVLVPNRTELGLLAGTGTPATLDEVVAAARALPVAAVVVTLGADGALVLADGTPRHVPAVPVDAVDATGAGDAFCGALGDALAGGAALHEATGWAVRAAARATTRRGAQQGMPTRAEVGGVTG